MQRAAELRRQGDDAAGAVPSERSHAFNALFAELRHAAAAVRASREPTVLEEYEHAHSIAWAAWAEARERTGEALSALHAAQHERLLARFTRAAEEAVRSDEAVAALRGEQVALLGARRFTDALQHLKRVKAAEAKAGVQHRLRTEAANEAAVTALHEQQTCERAALELFASEFEGEAHYAYSKRLFELGAPPAKVWPQHEPAYVAPAGWHEAAQWAGEPAYGEPQSLASLWHAAPAWENVPPPHNAGEYAHAESWAAHDAPAFWGGAASGWPGPEPQPFTEHSAPAAPPLLPLAPIPAGWGGRPARREEPAARPASSGAAEADVMTKLLAAMALAAERKLAPPPEPPAAVRADARAPVPAAIAPRDTVSAPAAAQETAAPEPAPPSWDAPPPPVAQFESQRAPWSAPAPLQELSDDSSSDAGSYSDDGADNLRDAPVADVTEQIAEVRQRSDEAAASASASAQAQVQPSGEASKAATASTAVAAGEAAAPPLALPAPQPPPALPAPLAMLPPADAGPQSGLGALLAARRETETAARAAAAQRREFTTADFRQLFSYCRHGKYRQAKDLLRTGCPVDGRDQFGNTPLIIACQNGHARLVKALLRHSAVIDAANKSGNTGLHYAVSFGFSQLADFLISQGADDKVRNAVGLTPYEGIK